MRAVGIPGVRGVGGVPQVFFGSVCKCRTNFCKSAEKCKRMRKNVKRKNLNTVASDERPLGFAPGELAPEWEFWAHTRQFS